MEHLLSIIAIVTGVAAGSLALIQAKRQPEKAQQMRRLSVLPFGMAALMALLLFL